MCQMNVVMDKEGRREEVLDEVAHLEVTPEGVVLSTLFDEPQLVAGSRVKEIDFMKTTVVLAGPSGTED